MLRDKYESLRKQADAAESEFKQVTQEFWDEIERAGMKSFKRDDGTNFIRMSTIYSSITDKEALMEAIEEAGLQEFVVTDIRKKALNEYVREALDKEEPLLPGLAFSVTRSIRRV